jgi:hypothetical protein
MGINGGPYVRVKPGLLVVDGALAVEVRVLVDVDAEIVEAVLAVGEGSSAADSSLQT